MFKYFCPFGDLNLVTFPFLVRFVPLKLQVILKTFLFCSFELSLFSECWYLCLMPINETFMVKSNVSDEYNERMVRMVTFSIMILDKFWHIYMYTYVLSDWAFKNVRAFPPNPKYLKYLNFALSDKNVKELFQKKALLPDIMEYNPSSNTSFKSIIGLCMPKNTDTWRITHFFCVQIKKNKSTHLPSQFSSQKGKQTFYF